MSAWKEELREEIAIYRSNIAELGNFSKEDFLKEYNELLSEMKKEITRYATDYYKKMMASHNSAASKTVANQSEKAQANAVDGPLKELKKNYKALLKAEENAKAEIKELNAKLRELRAERKQLTESLNGGGFLNSLHNSLFGDYKRDKVNELESAIAECTKKIAELKKLVLSDEEKEDYEIEIKTKEDDLKRLRRAIGKTKKTVESDEKELLSTNDAFLRVLDNIYFMYFGKLKELGGFKKYQQLLSRVDLTQDSAYVFEHYKKLSQLSYICSGGVFKASLPDSFSAPCREAFSRINGYMFSDASRIFAEREQQTALRVQIVDEHSDISDEFIYEIFGMNKNKAPKKPQKDTKKVSASSDSLFLQAVDLLREVDAVSSTVLQRRLGLGNARAARMLDELESAGLIGEYNGSRPRSVNKEAVEGYIAASGEPNMPENQAAADTLPEYIIKALKKTLDGESITRLKHFLELRGDDAKGVCLNPDFLIRIEEVLENTEGELPEIAIELVKGDFETHDVYHSKMLAFKDLYYATPEQVAIANDEYYAKKKIEQIERNARLEREQARELAERQMQEDRANAEIVAQAERERAAAINRQTSEMARQSELDRIAANRRSQDEIRAQQRIAENERRERDAAQREADRRRRDAESKENWARNNAMHRCSKCKKRFACGINRGNPNCGAFEPV